MGTPPAFSECHDMVKQLLAGLPGVAQIKDDLVVHRCGKEHNIRLQQVLERFKQAGLTMRSARYGSRKSPGSAKCSASRG